MRNKKAKMLRKTAYSLGHSVLPKYGEVRFKRKVLYREYKEDGTYKIKETHYPVRTLFLKGCARATYLRLKRKSREEQKSIVSLINRLNEGAAHA